MDGAVVRYYYTHPQSDYPSRRGEKRTRNKRKEKGDTHPQCKPRLAWGRVPKVLVNFLGNCCCINNGFNTLLCNVGLYQDHEGVHVHRYECNVVSRGR